MPNLRISNKDARALWLTTHGLASAPTGPCDALAIIRQLGFVQLDSIQVVSRAHHHIIWSRNTNYRERMLHKLLGRDRAVFEHFTHDASVLPMETLPAWQRQFRRKREQIERANWWKSMPGPDERAEIRARIEAEGALCTRDFESEIEGPKEMWTRPPHKQALDFMWYAGELATCYRDGFTKYYNLAERVFPAPLREADMADTDQIAYLCRAALSHIGFGTLTEIRAFWDATTPAEVSQWAETAELLPVEIESADGIWAKSFACPDIEARLAALEPPTTRLRILNPFDPAIRDRKRLARLFGFDYTVEMFVPAAKRRWGYYVFPLLEGDRFVGRIDARADRKSGALEVLNHWREPGIRASKQRAGKLDAELARLARFAGLNAVTWTCERTAL